MLSSRAAGQPHSHHAERRRRRHRCRRSCGRWPSSGESRLRSEIERWTPEQLLDLIFQPGFSTRASATDVSGPRRRHGRRQERGRAAGRRRARSVRDRQGHDRHAEPAAVARAAARRAARGRRRAVRAADRGGPPHPAGVARPTSASCSKGRSPTSMARAFR